jgi:dolichyl-phosphate beta-glucosyltransferase
MWGATQPGRDLETPVSLEIIVPAHNEAQRLPYGLKALTEAAAALPCGAAVLVVDNASTDDTAAIVQEWPQGPVPVRLLGCARRGKGAAVRTGLLASRAPFVGFLDADMATGLSALSSAMSLLVTGHQIVIGSRAHAQSAVEERHSMVRALGAAVFRGAARAIVAGVTDTQCGFKFFSGPLARAAAAAMNTSGFSFDVELLARCRRLGAEVKEIPVQWRDIPGSTFSVQRHGLSAFAELASIWMSLHADGDRGPRPIPVPPAFDRVPESRPGQPVRPGGTRPAGPVGDAASDAVADAVPEVVADAGPPVSDGPEPVWVYGAPGEARAPSRGL